MIEALGRGALAVDDAIRLDGRITTVGRFLVGRCLPPSHRADVEAQAVTADRLRELLTRVTRDQHVEIAARAAEALELLGRTFADRSGFSLARHDFEGPPQTDALVAAGVARVREVIAQTDDGLITIVERLQKISDVWNGVIDQVRAAARGEAPARDPLAALSAAYVGASPPEHLRTMRGFVDAGPWGCAHESPILHTRGEGLTPHEYMMECRAARRAALEQHKRDAVAATLLHDLHAILGDAVVTARDCGTQRGVLVERLEPPEECVFVPLSTRVEGRVLARDVVSTAGAVVARARTLVTRPLAERLEAPETADVWLLDPTTCDAAEGVCAACFGLDPDDATWPAVGDEVGARAAFAIAEEARTMTTHRFHIC